jgi:hypothetical protein
LFACEKPKPGWLNRRREQKRLKRERTGDTPAKAAERGKPQETTVKDAANRAGIGGFVSGGGIGM